MDDNFVWCALIFALAYVGRNMLPSYYELTKAKHSRIDAINDAVDDNEQTMLAMGKRLEELQSDIAGHLTRLDDMKEAFEKMKELVDLHERRLDLHLERIDISHDAAADTDHEIIEIFKRLEVVERKTTGLAEQMP
jgi:predicted  nucleic acid-binding Zn-ribbon protein